MAIDKGRREAINKAHADAVANDRDTPWSPAWVADRMARTDGAYRRVQDDPDCCGGLRCYHYTTAPVKRVTGRGAAQPTGATISLHDTLMRLRGIAARK